MTLVIINLLNIYMRLDKKYIISYIIIKKIKSFKGI
jgi:hypothetical protein